MPELVPQKTVGRSRFHARANICSSMIVYEADGKMRSQEEQRGKHGDPESKPKPPKLPRRPCDPRHVPAPFRASGSAWCPAPRRRARTGHPPPPDDAQRGGDGVGNAEGDGEDYRSSSAEEAPDIATVPFPPATSAATVATMRSGPGRYHSRPTVVKQTMAQARAITAHTIRPHN